MASGFALPRGLVLAGVAVGGALTAAAAYRVGVGPGTAFGLTAAACTLVACGYLVMYVDPAWGVSGAIAISVFNGNWDGLGFPSAVPPDRLLLVASIAAVVLRAPAARDRSALEWRPVHWWLLLAALMATASGIAAGTLFDGSGIFRVIDRFGVMPFALYLIAPVVFDTPERRRLLLRALTILGGYLGVTALFESVGLASFVWPKYILEPTYGYQPGRARGPFAESLANGLALYVCAVAALMLLTRIRSTLGRAAVGAVVALNLAGLLFTLQRAVWVGGVLATIAAFLMAPRLRRHFASAILATATIVTASLLLIPGLGEKVQERRANQSTVFDRQNLNAAALEVIQDKPLFGVGLNRFTEVSSSYWKQSADYQLTVIPESVIHNVFLSNAVDLGLICTGVWLVALLGAITSAVFRRGPPTDLAHWRIALVPIAVMWFVAASTAPLPQAFPNQILWLWAGVAYGRRADHVR